MHKRAFLTAVLEAIEANRRAIREANDTSGISSQQHADYWRKNWRSVSFTFTKEIFEHPQLADLSADDYIEASERIECVFEELIRTGEIEHVGDDPWTCALGTKGAKDVPDDPYEDFLSCWQKIQSSPLRVALSRAQALPEYQDPARFGQKFAVPRRAQARRFFAVVRELCKDSKDGVCPVAQEVFAELLAVPRRSIGRWLQEAATLGMLEKVNEAVARVSAAEYRWIDLEQ